MRRRKKKPNDDEAEGSQDEDLQKPFKESLRSLFTQKIIRIICPKARHACQLEDLRRIYRRWTEPLGGGSIGSRMVALTGGQICAKGSDRQLKMALESVKVSHLVKDVRQKGTHKGNQRGNNYGKGKVINMVRKNVNDKKRKSRIQEKEGWMNVPITFPPVLPGDMSDEPLIVEAEVEGSLSFHQSPVEGVSNILSGVLGRGVAVTEEDIVGDIIQKRRIIPKNYHEIHRCSITDAPVEEVLVNPAFPNQKITSGRRFSKECRFQLLELLKNSKMYSHGASDMTGVP
ncbi:hypothetical protein Tco_0627189 [Tanacetum coccineum]|uniref:Uncharacterized protein n=1 Tax=Tanacetum coccineum TaxID=301880 RepID=A0ABQ4WLT7_9ASTR